MQEVKDLSVDNLRRQFAESRALLGDHLRLYQVHSATLESGATFEKALALNPKEAAAHQGLGLLGLDQADYAGAEVHFRRAILDEPAELIFHLNLARALRGQQRFEAAMQELDRSKQLDPENPDVDAAFGRYYTQTEQYSSAVDSYRAAISRRPDQADYHLGLADTLLDLKRYDEALAEGDRTVELGEVSLGQLFRAYALSYLKQFSAARRRSSCKTSPADRFVVARSLLMPRLVSGPAPPHRRPAPLAQEPSRRPPV